VKARSLRLRLLILSAGTVLVALLLAGLAIATIFSSHVERNLEAQLQAQMTRLTALVNAATQVPELGAPMADPRFDVPAGGLYWQIADEAGAVLLRSRSLWDDTIDLPTAISEAGSIERVTDPAGLPALALTRRLVFEMESGVAPRTLVLTIAERTDGIDAANAAFRDDLLFALSILGVALMLASAIQIQLGLRPLDAVQRGIATIRSGGSANLSSDYPSEVMPLVTEVNELLDLQERSIGFARDRASDLAHGLKTSLTLLNGEAEAMRRAGAEATADRVEAIAGDMLATVDHQLRLSRLRHRARLERQSSALRDPVLRIVETLRRTPSGMALDWQVDLPETMSFPLDRMDLMELLGVLLENAGKWAASRVAITAEGTVLRIDDDGPGVADAVLHRLGERGVRADQTAPGAGLGLAIAREIVAINGGSLQFGRSALGGLRVEVSLAAG
jgi:signal transduction histidine kinase